MDKKKSATHYTEVHFHAPVGQYIDFIENQTVSFDKDMNMHVAHVENKKEEPYIPPVPQKGKYNQVREHIEERKRYDEEFKNFYDTHSLRDVCSQLTDEFGWFVDDKSLGKNLNRHI